MAKELKKKIGRPPKGKTAKKSYNVYLEEAHKDAIVKKHGSLTRAIETTAPNPNNSSTKKKQPNTRKQQQ